VLGPYQEVRNEMILPLIKRMDESTDAHRKKRPGVVDLVIFDGVSNVVKAGKLLAINHPRAELGKLGRLSWC